MAANLDYGTASKWLERISTRVRSIACAEFCFYFPDARIVSVRRPTPVELSPRTMQWMLRAVPNAVHVLGDTRIAVGSSHESLAECGLSRDARRRLSRAGIVDVERLSSRSLAQLAQFVGWKRVWSILSSLARLPRTKNVPEFSTPLVESSALRRDLWSILITTGDAMWADHRLNMPAGSPNIPCAVVILRALGFSPARGTEQFSPGEVRRRVDALGRLSLYDECLSVLRVAERQSASPLASWRRNQEVLAFNLGFRTGQPETLEVTGQRFGISRERVRQIRKRLMCRVERPLAPVLDCALRIVASACPASAEIVDDRLREAGILDDGGGVRTVLEVANCLGREREAEDVIIEGNTVSTQFDHARAKLIVKTARKMVSRHGAANVEMVSQHLVEIGQASLATSVKEELEFAEGCRWLGRAGEWFWFPSAHARRRHNPLLRRIRKALAVSKGLTRQEIRAAVDRDHRLLYVPPSLIFQHLGVQSKLAEIRSGRLVLRSPCDWKMVVKGDEAVVVQLLMQSGGALRRRPLQEAACSMGVATPSFWQCIKYRPTTTFTKGVVCLVGVTAPSELLHRRPARFRPTVIDHGWTVQGCLWIGYRVSDAIAETGVVSVPAAKRNLLGRNYNIYDSEGEPNGNLVVQKSSAWGLGPLLRRFQVRSGTHLVLEFDLAGKRVVAHLGSEAIFSSFAAR